MKLVEIAEYFWGNLVEIQFDSIKKIEDEKEYLESISKELKISRSDVNQLSGIVFLKVKDFENNKIESIKPEENTKYMSIKNIFLKNRKVYKNELMDGEDAFLYNTSGENIFKKLREEIVFTDNRQSLELNKYSEFNDKKIILKVYLSNFKINTEIGRENKDRIKTVLKNEAMLGEINNILLEKKGIAILHIKLNKIEKKVKTKSLSNRNNNKKIKELVYNMIGQGKLNIIIYPQTDQVYKFLKRKKYDIKLKNMRQLGAMTNYLSGAHHTRDEYVLLQWHIINILKEANGMGISTTNKNIKGINGSISNAEVLQILALLTNIGHFPGTFAVSRTWLDLLVNNTKKVKTGFLDGLDKNEKEIAREIIDNFEVRRIHLINTLFLLNRMKGIDNEKKYVNTLKEILMSYLKNDAENRKLWKIFKGVRMIAFLILDSTYAPLTFNMNITSVKDNILEIFDDIIKDEESEVIKSLYNINEYMEESLYMAPNSMLTVSDYSNYIYEKFNKSKEEFSKRSKVRRLLEPFNEKEILSEIFQRYSEVDRMKRTWKREYTLEFKYSNAKRYIDIFPKNYVEWENIQKKKIGNINISADYSSNGTFKVIYGLKKENFLRKEQVFIKNMRIINNMFILENKRKINDYKNMYTIDNYKTMLKAILNAITKEPCYYKFESIEIENNDKVPYFQEKGAKNLANKIKLYREILEKSKMDNDKIHEVKATEEYLKTIDFKGEMLAFVGATKVYNYDKSTEAAEFDGIIVIPGKKSIIIVEAKNKNSAEKFARMQLQNRSNLIEGEFLQINIEDIMGMGAIMKLTIKEEAN